MARTIEIQTESWCPDDCGYFEFDYSDAVYYTMSGKPKTQRSCYCSNLAICKNAVNAYCKNAMNAMKAYKESLEVKE